ncbi:M20/M25/M40 family metallo-hydrolase [Selenomonadales bacterium OttesenSCG-928-I06]|nr:M20/M25/M40 family metallo-hydrolase [Selenomonadales bacterium OttesenSCG-928-I06]
MINKERALKEFFELVQIYAPPRQERKVADKIKEIIKEIDFAGLELAEDDAGAKIEGNCNNFIINIKGNVKKAPIILFSAHFDSVEPCENVVPVLKDGVITSEGNTVLGADDKAGLVAILEALRVIKENQLPHGDLQIVFTVSEEGGLHGSRNLDPTILKADIGYVLDAGGSPGTIINKAPGQNHIDAIIYGRKAHAGIDPESGINAIKIAAEALCQIDLGRIDFETTANIGLIEGGSATNVVPDKVVLKGEVRSHSEKKLADKIESMEKAFYSAAKKNNSESFVEVKHAYIPFAIEENENVILLAKKAAESIGLKSSIVPTGGGSDANNFNKYGVKTAALGIGMTKVHTTEEYILEEDLYNCVRLVLAIIQKSVEN